MNRARIGVIATAVIAAFILAGCAAVAPRGEQLEPSGTAHSELTAALDISVAGMLAETGIPSAAFLVTQGDEQLWAQAYNAPDAGTEPITLDSNFGYRSVTKSFVATTLLLLADKGMLSLDDPVSAYVDGVPGGETITLRDLAAMRSGLANYSALPAVGELIGSDPTGTFTDTQMLAPALAEAPLFAPDAAYMYSNTNTLLLGQVIEKVSGLPWAEAVDQYVTAPLGLSSVAYPATPSLPDPATVPYQVDESGIEELPVVSFSLFGAAGGLVGTVADLAAWADALGTGALLQAATQANRIASLGPTSDDPASPEYDAYGLGLGEIDGWIGHTGNGLGFQALAMHNMESGMSVAILINSTTADGDLPAHLFQLMALGLDAL